MIRIQIFCHACHQLVDATVSAQRGRIIAAAFEDAHLFERCTQEIDTDGQDEEGATSDETAGPQQEEVEAARQGKVH